ncbi:helix-turn-helix domain-containing protein [Clostridium sp. ZS1]|uniref:helix-turn-helix domain-containing protein n=1 Tax=Clostridium sp. ZS1 TaxID=2949989 RepID=UPI0020795E99|nr:helix-turn-helix domain-containing protein [Clostridium sp. ZS1]
MGRKAKFSYEIKIDVVTKCLQGKSSANYEANLLGINPARVFEWISLYKSLGKDGLITTSQNTKYSTTLKKNAVFDYINGLGSYSDICNKYGIRSSSQLRNWIMKYNSHNKFKTSGTGGIHIMTKGRATTYKERIEIIKYCIENENDYAETAEKYKVSYQQVYSWIKKYQTKGIEALQYGRGKRKKESEMSELEKLQAKNKLLEAENRRQQMEIEFLKKLEEIERGRF